MVKHIIVPRFSQTRFAQLKMFTWCDIQLSGESNSKAITQLISQGEGAIQTLSCSTLPG